MSARHGALTHKPRQDGSPGAESCVRDTLGDAGRTHPVGEGEPSKGVGRRGNRGAAWSYGDPSESGEGGEDLSAKTAARRGGLREGALRREGQARGRAESTPPPPVCPLAARGARASAPEREAVVAAHGSEAGRWWAALWARVREQ